MAVALIAGIVHKSLQKLTKNKDEKIEESEE
jgi:hypothetical protein